MGNGASKKLGVDVPHNTQGEPYPIVRMGPYWMGHSSVKVTKLITSLAQVKFVLLVAGIGS